MKTVVFILSYSNNQNAIKRLEEFLEHGIAVDAYGFKRHDITNIKTERIKVNIIGSFDNLVNYRKRVPIMSKGIQAVLKKYKNSDVLYYLFGLDVAGLFKLHCSKPYIYEEEDLIYTYFNNRLLRLLFAKLDRYVVKNSVRTIFTSDGFANYHFGSNWPTKVSIIPNKLKKDVLNYPALSHEVDLRHLRIAFVGSFRFQSVYNFARVYLQSFPDTELLNSPSESSGADSEASQEFPSEDLPLFTAPADGYRSYIVFGIEKPVKILISCHSLFALKAHYSIKSRDYSAAAVKEHLVRKPHLASAE